MLNRSAMTIVGIVFISFCSLVSIKFYVHDLKDEVVTLERAKSDELNQIKVLKAEWAYLNKADRLQYLASKYLALNEVKSSKITVLGQATQNKLHLVANDANKPIEAIFQRPTNWRYKSREKILVNKHMKRRNASGSPVVAMKGVEVR